MSALFLSKMHQKVQRDSPNIELRTQNGKRMRRQKDGSRTNSIIFTSFFYLFAIRFLSLCDPSFSYYFLVFSSSDLLHFRRDAHQILFPHGHSSCCLVSSALRGRYVNSLLFSKVRLTKGFKRIFWTLDPLELVWVGIPF